MSRQDFLVKNVYKACGSGCGDTATYWAGGNACQWSFSASPHQEKTLDGDGEGGDLRLEDAAPWGDFLRTPGDE